jgi:hypothetical protein
VIGELETAQGKVKQAMHDTEEKLTTLTAQGVEEILGNRGRNNKGCCDKQRMPPKIS